MHCRRRREALSTVVSSMPETARSLDRLSVLALFLTISLLEKFTTVEGKSQSVDTAAYEPGGTRQCPLDISVLWTADLDSPVYSTPIIIPAGVGASKQIVIATLRNAVELLEGDGSVPPAWPIEIQGSAFHASPAVHDIDGDGIQDICVAGTDGRIAWLSSGNRGPFLREFSSGDHAPRLPPHKVKKKWYEGLDDPDVDVHYLEQGAEDRQTADKAALQQRNRELRAQPRAEGVEEGMMNYDPRFTGGRSLLADEADAGVNDVQPEDADFLAGGYAEFQTDADLLEEFLHDATYGYGAGPSDDLWGMDWGYQPFVAEDDYVLVDAHVLAAPAFADVDGDGSKEMIVPVSYFFDRHQYAESSQDFKPEKYVSASLACWDFKQKKWTWTQHLGQTTDEADKRGYVYASPTIADIDGDGALDVVIATALGHVHLLDGKTGASKEGFPVEGYDAIKGQVAVADVDQDADGLEMLFGDRSGSLVCLRADGTELWNMKQPGAISSTVMLGDLDGGGGLDIVVGVTTSEGDGQICAVSALEGLKLPYFPLELGNRKGISAPILLVDLHEKSAGQLLTIDSRGQKGQRKGAEVRLGGDGAGLHLLAPSEDGHVYVVEAATGCVNKIDFGERLLSMVLADDLLGDGTLDLIVGTMSGEMVALSTNVPFHPSNSWSSPARGHLNGFVHGRYQGVYFVGPRSKYEHVVGKDFAVAFEIVDQQPSIGKQERSYEVAITAGSVLVFTNTYNSPGAKKATIALRAPTNTMLRIQMTTRLHLVYEDHVSVGYNTAFYATLKWMLVAPVALAALPFWWLSQPSNTGIPLPP